MQTDQIDTYVTPATAGSILGVSGETIRRWCKQGCPHRFRGLRERLVRVSDVEAWVRDQAEQRRGGAEQQSGGES